MIFYKGFTFKASLPNDDDANKEHVCIIVQSRAIDDQYYVYMTSQDRDVNCYYDKIDPAGYVQVQEAEVKKYFAYTRITYILCGAKDVHCINGKTLNEKIERGIFQKVVDISSELFDQIEFAIMDSITYNNFN